MNAKPKKSTDLLELLPLRVHAHLTVFPVGSEQGRSDFVNFRQRLQELNHRLKGIRVTDQRGPGEIARAAVLQVERYGAGDGMPGFFLVGHSVQLANRLFPVSRSKRLANRLPISRARIYPDGTLTFREGVSLVFMLAGGRMTAVQFHETSMVHSAVQSTNKCRFAKEIGRAAGGARKNYAGLPSVTYRYLVSIGGLVRIERRFNGTFAVHSGPNGLEKEKPRRTGADGYMRLITKPMLTESYHGVSA